MKTFVTVTLLLFSQVTSVTGFSEERGTLIVQFTGIEEARGNVMVAVYDSREKFLTRDVIEKAKLNITHEEMLETVHVVFELPPGEYALSVFLDKNSNGDLDRNFLGIPVEKYGFSNNVRRLLGPPSFEDAKVRLWKEKVSIVIEVE